MLLPRCCLWRSVRCRRRVLHRYRLRAWRLELWWKQMLLRAPRRGFESVRPLRGCELLRRRVRELPHGVIRGLLLWPWMHPSLRHRWKLFEPLSPPLVRPLDRLRTRLLLLRNPAHEYLLGDEIAPSRRVTISTCRPRQRRMPWIDSADSMVSTVAREHCAIWYDEKTWKICNLGSTNGTRLDGQFLGTAAFDDCPGLSVTVSTPHRARHPRAWRCLRDHFDGRPHTGIRQSDTVSLTLPAPDEPGRLRAVSTVRSTDQGCRDEAPARYSRTSSQPECGGGLQ